MLTASVQTDIGPLKRKVFLRTRACRERKPKYNSERILFRSLNDRSASFRANTAPYTPPTVEEEGHRWPLGGNGNDIRGGNNVDGSL